MSPGRGDPAESCPSVALTWPALLSITKNGLGRTLEPLDLCEPLQDSLPGVPPGCTLLWSGCARKVDQTFQRHKPLLSGQQAINLAFARSRAWRSLQLTSGKLRWSLLSIVFMQVSAAMSRHRAIRNRAYSYDEDYDDYYDEEEEEGSDEHYQPPPRNSTRYASCTVVPLCTSKVDSLCVLCQCRRHGSQPGGDRDTAACRARGDILFVLLL